MVRSRAFSLGVCTSVEPHTIVSPTSPRIQYQLRVCLQLGFHSQHWMLFQILLEETADGDAIAFSDGDRHVVVSRVVDVSHDSALGSLLWPHGRGRDLVIGLAPVDLLLQRLRRVQRRKDRRHTLEVRC